MQTDPTLTRRGFTVLTFAGGLSLAMPGVALAAIDTDQARALIGQVVGDILDIINSGNSESQMLVDFEEIMARYGDMPIIAQTVLGVDWRRATAAQRRAFTEAFQGYMSRKYGRRFREFIGGRIEVTGARQVRNVYEVISTVYLQGQAPFELVWLVSDGSGQNRFFNLIIEGINLRTTERTEIGSMLDRRGGDLDLMIQDLRGAG